MNRNMIHFYQWGVSNGYMTTELNTEWSLNNRDDVFVLMFPFRASCYSTCM